MKKRLFGIGILVLVLVIGMMLVGCDNDNNQPQSVIFTGTANGVMYTLKITQNSESRSVYSPTAGDIYELTIGSKKSNGSVVLFTGGIFTLRSSVAQTITFTVTVSGSSISNISGTITWNDNSTTDGPGSINGGNNNGDGGVFVLTNIPSEYNGKYAMLQCFYVHGFNSYDPVTGYILPQISNGGVSMPLWLLGNDEYIGRYSGNHTFQDEVVFVIYASSSMNEEIALLVIPSITFSNGSATKSWSDGTLYED